MYDHVAFVLISTGPFARTCKAEVALESMYRIAGYKGKAFLITDSPECYNSKTLEELCGTDKIGIVAVEKFSNKLNLPFTIQWKKLGKLALPLIRTITPVKRYKSKALKAEIFNLVQDPEVEVLIYIDSDVVFMREEGLDDLLRTAAGNWKEKEFRVRVTKWDNHEQIFNANCHIHGGFFIVHRYYSKDALAHWGRVMSVEQFWIENVTDKEKFLRAYAEASALPGPNYMKVVPLPPFEVIIDPDKNEGLIGHITNGRIRHHGKKKIEEFISKFDLKAYPKGYYTLPGMPLWLDNILFFGYPPSFGTYKIEYVWKAVCNFFGHL